MSERTEAEIRADLADLARQRDADIAAENAEPDPLATNGHYAQRALVRATRKRELLRELNAWPGALT